MRRLSWVSALFGLLVFWAIAGWAFTENVRKQSWTRVPATILTSDVRHYTASCGSSGSRICTFYEPQVRYGYELGGRRFESSNLGGVRSASTNPRSAQAEAAEFPRGAGVTAFVDPENPARAVLRTAVPAWYVALFFAAGIVWAAVWILIGRLVARPKAEAARA